MRIQDADYVLHLRETVTGPILPVLTALMLHYKVIHSLQHFQRNCLFKTRRFAVKEERSFSKRGKNRISFFPQGGFRVITVQSFGSCLCAGN